MKLLQTTLLILITYFGYSQSNIYGLVRNGDVTDSQLHILNSNDGSAALVGTLTGLKRIYETGFDPLFNKIIVNGLNSEDSSKNFVIDPSNASFTSYDLWFSQQSTWSIDFVSSDTQVYALVRNGDVTDSQLYAFNSSDGSAELVGTLTGLKRIYETRFDPVNYKIIVNGINSEDRPKNFVIDPSNASFTSYDLWFSQQSTWSISFVSNDNQVYALARNGDVTDSQLYTFNSNDGSASLVGTLTGLKRIYESGFDPVNNKIIVNGIDSEDHPKNFVIDPSNASFTSYDLWFSQQSTWSIDFVSNENRYDPNSIENPIVNQIELFPNPTSDKIKLSSVQNWKLTNSKGIIIEKGSSDSIDLTNKGSGLYFLLLDNGQTKKIIKK